MYKPRKKRQFMKLATLSLFILGLVVLSITGNWWPGIMLVFALPLSLWQFLHGRKFDMAVTLFVFIGAFVTVQFSINWEVFLPVLFTIGGIYIFFREWIESATDPIEEEQEEDIDELKEEIDDSEKED